MGETPCYKVYFADLVLSFRFSVLEFVVVVFRGFEPRDRTMNVPLRQLSPAPALMLNMYNGLFKRVSVPEYQSQLTLLVSALS